MLELVLFLALFVTRNIAETLIVPRRWDSRPPTRGRGLTTLVAMGLAYYASGVAVAVTLYLWGPPATWLCYLGLASLAAGLAGRIACVRQLGTAYSQSFEVDPEGHLVTAGIYGVIRHPVYAFFLLELVAMVLIRPNVVSTVALALVAAASVYRIRREEERLVARFGERYLSYRRRTRAVIPYLL